MNKLTEQQLNELHELCIAKPRDAIRTIREWEITYASDFNFVRNKAAFLIDAGSALRHPQTIQEGIDILQTESEAAEKSGATLNKNIFYNLANGYYALENTRRGKKGYVYDPTNTPMTFAKHYYRKEIEQTSSDNNQIASASTFINYGNSLNELGRPFEAVEQYEAALQKDDEHPLAWSRLADTFLDIAPIVQNPRLLKSAVESYDQALKGTRISKYGYMHNLPHIRKNRTRAISWLKRLSWNEDANHKQLEIPSDYQQAFVHFCVSHRLFLNFSFNRAEAFHPYEDNLNVKITTRIDDDTRFTRLIRVINELTERFAAARLLLFEALETPYDTTFYDTITRYVDLSDGSVYGIRVAKLKLAFESVFNILDKIALFIYEYLEIGQNENLNVKQVCFTTIWNQKNGVLRQSILDRQNQYLFGLYDLASEFMKEGSMAFFKEFRNYLTHRYLVVHPFDNWDWQAGDGVDYHCTWDELRDRTLSLFSITRNAVLYFNAAIHLDEIKHYQTNSREKVYTRHYYFHNPEFPAF